MGYMDQYNSDMGSSFDYPVGPVTLPAAQLAADYNAITNYVPGNVILYNGAYYINLIACVGVDPPAANWQAYGSNVNPGAITNASFTIINDDFDGIDLMGYWTGPFLVEIFNAYTSLSNGPCHGYTIISNVPGQPQRLLLPMRARYNDTIQFALQDLSGALNVIFLTVRGVQLKRS